LKLESIFARLLKEHRKRSGLSQEALALLANVDRTFISMLEGGKRQPTLTTLFSLAKALDITPSTLVKAIEQETKFDSIDAEQYVNSISTKRSKT
jgi:transcriptional regulator with XRE-family HTH domain